MAKAAHMQQKTNDNQGFSKKSGANSVMPRVKIPLILSKIGIGCHLYCFYEVNKFQWLERLGKNDPKLKSLVALKSAHPIFLENHCPNLITQKYQTGYCTLL